MSGLEKIGGVGAGTQYGDDSGAAGVSFAVAGTLNNAGLIVGGAGGKGHGSYRGDGGTGVSFAADDSADASTQASEPGRETRGTAEVPEALRAALETHPELQRVWDEAEAYCETFATPEAARAATAQIADLNRLDALFFSRRPEDHAELARAVLVDTQAHRR